MFLDDLLSTAQVMERFGYTRARISQAVLNGELVPAFKVPTKGAKNGAYLFTEQAVRQWRPFGRLNAKKSERPTPARVRRSVSDSTPQTNGETWQL